MIDNMNRSDACAPSRAERRSGSPALGRISGALFAVGTLFASLPAHAGDGVSHAVTSVHWAGVGSDDVQRLLDAGIASQRHDLLDAERIDALCQQLTDALRRAGYMVAQVVVTQRDREAFENTGELRLTVFEGKVGKITVHNSSRVRDSRIENIATDALCPNGVGDQCVLTSKRLERAELLLQDVPGVKLDPVTLGPKSVGVGQTAVDLTTAQNQPLVSGFVGVDDYGMASTGVGRLTAGVTLTNLLHEGDVLQVQGTATNRHEDAGSLLGSAPLGNGGLRGQFSVSHFLYSVPEVGSSGNADTFTAGFAYPLRRGLGGNWTFALDGLETISRQDVGGMQAFAPRKIYSGRLSLQGNAGDRPMQLGDSYWTSSASWEFGDVSQDLGGMSDLSGQLGHFNKFNVSLLGKLNLGATDKWYVVGSLQGQYATRNLDWSEKLNIGGQSGVRAYRADEGGLDSGVLLSLELRRLFTLPNGGHVSVGPIVDYAAGVLNAHPYDGWQVMNGYSDPTLSNHRTLASWGVGVDWVSPHGYSASLTWSTRFPGSADSVNYPGSASSRILASLTTKF